MISESFYWKDELYKCYISLAKFINQKKYYESSFIKAEKAILLSAYIIRKLDDAEKIPPNFLKESITIEYYNSTNRIVDHYSAIDFDKNYDLNFKQNETKSILFFIDQIIHSFSYSITFSETTNTLEGFFLNSDKTKNQKLYYFPLEKYLALILKISEGWIKSQTSHRDDKTHEMKLVNAEYEYPNNFNITKILNETFKGNIYKRYKN